MWLFVVLDVAEGGLVLFAAVVAVVVGIGVVDGGGGGVVLAAVEGVALLEGVVVSLADELELGAFAEVVAGLLVAAPATPITTTAAPTATAPVTRLRSSAH